MSKRDEILSARNNVRNKQQPGMGGASQPLTTSARTPPTAGPSSGTAGVASGSNPQLLVNYEKILGKNLVLTNDLNDRDTEIIALKKEKQVCQSVCLSVRLSLLVSPVGVRHSAVSVF